jgi:hypothetical protein
LGSIGFAGVLGASILLFPLALVGFLAWGIYEFL